MLPSFQGYYKTAPLIIPCFFQAFTHPGQCRCIKVQGKLGNSCLQGPHCSHHLLASLEPPPWILTATPAVGHNAPMYLKDLYCQYTLSFCHLLCPHPQILPPQRADHLSNVPGTRHGNTEPSW